ncbi:glutaredoxin 3 [Paraburkholderia sp. GAS199]|uniref:glutaredoxin 3 n=1 Tax=Paraburkholderia sp. GAS199 TaxID=3035126 RepID=UPI003D1D2AF0
MDKVVMYSQTVCPYCERAERLLRARGVENIEKIMIDRDAGQREQMMLRTGRRTVPQIYIGETHVGGFDDLAALDRAGGLSSLLNVGN